jgi:hypothetical protein
MIIKILHALQAAQDSQLTSQFIPCRALWEKQQEHRVQFQPADEHGERKNDFYGI